MGDATWQPKLGDPVTNTDASDDNPLKHGFFIRQIRRTGRLNPGPLWECITDGRIWHHKPKGMIPGPVTPQTAALTRARELIAEIREQDFESYTVGGDPASMDEAEAGWIGEYDAVLGLIDGVLNG